MTAFTGAGKPAPHQGNVTHYAGDTLTAIRQAPAAARAFISVFTHHPAPHGSATQAGSIAFALIAVVVIFAVARAVRSRPKRRTA